MGLSLLFNYALVFSLVALGIYSREVIFTLFLAECLIFLVMALPGLKKPVSEIIRKSAIYNFDTVNDKEKAYLKMLTAGIILFIAVWFYYFFLKNVGTIFNLWDDVHSWNKWALEWTSKIPEMTWLYPQLLPANWSLSYIMTGTQLQFFPKMVQPLFSIMIFLILFDAALLRKKISYFIAVPAAGILLMNIYQGNLFLSSGHVDIATAFIALMSIYCLFIPELDDIKLKSEIKKYLLLGAVFSAAAGVTKQAGLWLTVIYPVLSAFIMNMSNKRINAPLRSAEFGTSKGQGDEAFMMNMSNKRAGSDKFTKKDFISFSLPLFAGALALVLPWYILKLATNPSGSDYKFVVALAENMYAGAGYYQRVVGTIVNYPHIYLCLALGIFSLKDNFSKFMYFGMALPYTIIWALFFSYDLRNDTMVIPMLAFSGTLGAVNIINSIVANFSGKQLKEGTANKRAFFSKIRLYWLPVIFIAGLAAINTVYYKKDSFFAYHDFLERQLGYPELDAFLYEYQNREGFDGMILTNYSTLEVLPDIKKYFKRVEFTTDEDTSSEAARNFFRYFNAHLSDTTNKYVLAPYYSHWAIKKTFDDRIKSGEYKLIFNEADYMLVKIR